MKIVLLLLRTNSMLLQFSELHNKELIEDLVCFYSAPDRRLDYVIQLGKYDYLPIKPSMPVPDLFSTCLHVFTTFPNGWDMRSYHANLRSSIQVEN